MKKLAIPSAINVTYWQLCQQADTIMENKCANENNNIIKNNILQTPSKVGVLQSTTFSHTPDEAMSVGLAKACVP